MRFTFERILSNRAKLRRCLMSVVVASACCAANEVTLMPAQADPGIRIQTPLEMQATASQNSSGEFVQTAYGNVMLSPGVAFAGGSNSSPANSNSMATTAAFTEDFSVPSLMPNQSTASTLPSNRSNQAASPFRTASLATAQPVPMAAAPVPAAHGPVMMSEPFVVGQEFVDEPYMYDGYSSPMTRAPYDAMGGPPVGYDLRSMSGCMGEDCRLYYFNAEALYWKQEEEDGFTYSNGRQLSDFDYEWGGRLTIGEMMDCVTGWEFVYTGPFEFERQRILDNTVPLESRFTLAGVPATLDTFSNSTVHSQRLETRLSTYEINRRQFASDMFSTLIGLRMADYDERYAFRAVANDGVGLGVFDNNVDNFLIGAQFGVNMYRPFTQRLSFGGWTKLALMANFARNRTSIFNRGVLRGEASHSDTSVAGLIQGGVGIRYRVLPRLTLTSGYEYLFLPRVATVSEQRPFPLTATSLSNVENDDTVFFHGANAGIEFSY
jgi:hypothetical protein